MAVSIYEKSVSYLQRDTLSNLTTLKYLLYYRAKAKVVLMEDAKDWALSAVIPSNLVSYDTLTYPRAEKSLFINGNSKELKYRLLNKLTNQCYILRLNDDLDLSPVKQRFHCERTRCYVSYTGSQTPDIVDDSSVIVSPVITDEVLSILKKNDYSEAEIRGYFRSGAIWFGLFLNNEIKSLCFVYRNYGDVWEIAGVHTSENERRKGYARLVVSAALKHLRQNHYIPRYNVEQTNVPSVALAQVLQLKPFLTIQHVLLTPK
ncbi:MAG: GNAT family N-acetyltransferase [Dehalococcoidales bacterium]|nr:GNAT family N-acetyltransferase [Dehalococcoidales bacterium]